MKIEKIVVGSLGTNCYIVYDEKSMDGVIIDPGTISAECGDMLIGKTMELGVNLKMVVNTHGHGDHIAGDGEIVEAFNIPVAIHEADAQYLEDTFLSKLRFDHPEKVLHEPDLLLKDGDTVSFGDITLKVMATPGHTAGSICLYTEGVLFSGDTLFYHTIGRSDLAGGSSKQILESLEKIMTLPDDTVVYPGHGGTTSIGEERKFNPFVR